MGEVFAWWLIVELLGIAALPLSALLFARLPDRGWALAKPLGVLVFGWLVWFPLSVLTFLPYSQQWIDGTLAIFALGNVLLLLRVPELRGALRRILARERLYIAASELVFAGAFALMAWIRSFTPAVVDQEKFMDVAFLSAIWRTPHLPPPDPWLSGYAINYYYFGHFLLATLAKLLGTVPAVAFNIGIALIFALTAVAVFGVATNLLAAIRRDRRNGERMDNGERNGERMDIGERNDQSHLGLAPIAGLASVLMVLILGNLDGAQVAWQQAVSLATGPGSVLSNPWAYFTNRTLWLGYNWWDPSRVITKPATINEFPAFSFLLADLHAHVLALPFAALALGLALSLIRSRGEGLRVFSPGGTEGSRLVGVVTVLGAALVLGALYAINGWDLPTYLGLALLALVIQQWLAHGRRIDTVLLLDLFAVAAVLVALVILLYLPFYHGFVSPSQDVGLVPGYAHSPVGLEFLIFGLQVAILGSYLVWQIGRWLGAALEEAPDVASVPLPLGLTSRALGLLVAVLAAVILVLLTMAIAGFLGWTLLWTLLLIGVCAALALRELGVWQVLRARRSEAKESKGDLDGAGIADRNGDNSPGDMAATATGETSLAPTMIHDALPALETSLAPTHESRLGAPLQQGEGEGGEVSESAPTVFVAEHLQPRFQPPGIQPPGVAEVWLLCLIGTGAALVCACELVFLRDVFAGGNGQLGDAFRMNTVFKLYYQAWLIAGVACGPALVLLIRAAVRLVWTLLSDAVALTPTATQATAPQATSDVGSTPVPAGELASWLPALTAASGTQESANATRESANAVRESDQSPIHAIDQRDSPHRSWVTTLSSAPYLKGNALRFVGAGGIVVWMVLLALLVAGALVYPVLGSVARTQNFSLPRSLDGTAYMATDSVNVGDAEAIAWLNSHVAGDAVIVEAAKYDEYTHLGRVSAFTGLPTLLGWGGHELQWRVNWLDQSGHEDVLGQRLDAVSQIYTNPDDATVKQLLRQYSVRLIYVGTAERQTYPTANLDRFAAFLPIVYSQNGVTIYAETGGASS